MTDSDLAKLVLKAQWAWPWAAVTAFTVSLAESAGDEFAVNVVKDPTSIAFRSIDRGLWQLNSYWHSEITDWEAFDPPTALAHTHRLSNAGRSWRLWVTWHNGSHRRFYPRAVTALHAEGLPL